MSSKNTTEKRWLSPKELASEFGLGLSTQAKLRMNNKIPYSKVGHWIRYDRLDIDKWIENNKIEMRA